MAEKVYLTSDQLVVKLLGEREEEITKLNERYDELLKKFVTLQAELKIFEELKSRFECKLTTNKCGYEIDYNPEHNSYGQTVLYCWELDPAKIEPKFQNLLDILCLSLPQVESNKEKEED